MEPDTSLEIFIVDDDLFSTTLYCKHLNNLGYHQVTAFNNGTDCLNSLAKEPSIIFLDFNMDILDGVEVLKKIKRFNPNIFVVFISGQEDVQTAVNSLKYGAFDYITKGANDTAKMESVLIKIHELIILMKKSRKGLVKTIFPFI